MSQFEQFTITGNGNPNDVVTGELGYLYVDLLNQDEYQSLGGQKWKLVRDNKIPLFERHMSTFSKLIGLRDLVLGETVTVNDRNVAYDVIKDTPETVLSLVRDSSLSPPRYDSFNANNFNEGFTFEVGDKIELEVKVHVGNLTENSFNKLEYRELGTGIIYTLGWRVRGSVNDYRIDTATNDGNYQPHFVVESVKTENGEDLDKYAVPFNIFVKVIFINTVKHTMDTGGFNIGHFLFDNSSAEIKSLKIRNENFKFDGTGGTSTTATTFIGDLGTVFSYIDKANNPNQRTATYIELKGVGDGVFIVEVDEQEYYRVLKLKVKNNTITPLMLGYKPNSNSITFNNDATPFIQACVDSEYDVFIPAGHYYIKQTITLNRPKTISMVGNVNPIFKNNLSKDVTSIYTDLDIDFWHIFVGGVFFEGGTMNVSAVKNPSGKRIWTYFYRDNLILEGKISGHVIGNEFETKLLGKGHIGLYFDSTTVNQDGLSPNGGEIHFLEIDIKASFINTVIVCSSENQNIRSNNSHTFNIISNGCKRAAIFKGGYGSLSILNGLHQSRRILQSSEKNFAVLEIESDSMNIDFFSWDLGESPSGGNYSHQWAIRNNAKLVTLGGRAYWNLRNGNVIELIPLANSLAKNINARDFVYYTPQQSNGDDGFIAQLDDALFIANIRHNMNVNWYNNTGFDLDYSDEAEGQSGAIKITDSSYGVASNLQNLFKYSNQIPKFEYTSLFKSQDFIEIVISNFAGTTSLELKSLLLSFYGNNYPVVTKIILIGAGVNGVDRIIFSKDTNLYNDSNRLIYIRNFNINVIKKVIIRMVGVVNPSKPVQISQIRAKSKEPFQKNIPYLNIEGGQRIFGSLEVEKLKVNDLPQNSSATDITTLVNDFNNLLNKLR